MALLRIKDMPFSESLASRIIAHAEFDKPVAVAQEKGQGDPRPRSNSTCRPMLRSQRPKYTEKLRPW